MKRETNLIFMVILLIVIINSCSLTKVFSPEGNMEISEINNEKIEIKINASDGIGIEKIELYVGDNRIKKYDYNGEKEVEFVDTIDNSIGIYKLQISNKYNFSSEILYHVYYTLFIEKVGYIDFRGSGRKIQISGNYAYITTFSGMNIIDISDPTNPVEVGYCSVEEDDPEEIYLLGDYAYLATGYDGLTVIDIKNPINPWIIKTYSLGSLMTGIYVSNNYVYMSDFSFGLVILDISNISNPKKVGSYEVPGFINNVSVLDNNAYITSDRGVYIVNISDPTNPKEIALIDSDVYSDVRDICFSGNYAYFVDDGLRIIDISNPQNPKKLGYYSIDDICYDLCFSNNYIYLTDYYEGLKIFDVNNSTNPILIGKFNVEKIKGVDVLDDYIYILSGGDLYIEKIFFDELRVDYLE